jgi:hypothetical protein
MKIYFIYFVLTTKVFPFTNHVFEFIFFQIMVIEMIFNDKIQKQFEMNLKFFFKCYKFVLY